MGKMGEVDAGLRPRHRDGDHVTSIKAAKKVAARAPSVMSRIEALIIAAGDSGLSDDEITHKMKEVHGVTLRDGGCRKRRSDLLALGRVKWSGAVRKSDAGQDQKVWISTAPCDRLPQFSGLAK